MKTKTTNSLSTKIVLSFMIISIVMIVLVFTIFENINKKAFYNIEIEKANIITQTIEPLIALNIYLDMTQKLDQIADNLMKNPNILAIQITKNKEIIFLKKSKEYETNLNSSFKVTREIFQPNSTFKMATLTLIYSNKTYKELTSKYTKLSILLLIFLFAVFLLLALFIKHLLSPLRKMAKSLKNFSPDKKLKFLFSDQNNEIGLISLALNEMQNKISQYAKKQQNINLYLEEKVNEKTLELRTQLYTDSLTNIPNRLKLIADTINESKASLLILNIDDFKEINDFFGNIAGDNILIKLSSNLVNIFSNKNNISINRLSGDEFAIYFEQYLSKQELIDIAKKLIQDIEQMVFLHEKNKISIRVTIGGAHNLNDTLLERADIALKLAKKRQVSFLLYDNNFNIEKQYKENMEWIKKLKKALAQDRVIPFYQVIYDNKTSKRASCECLIRLKDTNGQIIGPHKFLAISKKARLYSTLTKLMVKKSCQYFQNIESDFSVNMSAEDMLNKDIVDYIKILIKKYNVAHRIIFEILESEGIENYEEISHFIKEMKSLGCKIAIDDFGSGYSNFEHLFKLDIDYIKIDGSLIKNLDTDTNAQAVIETIVSFSQKLNIITIAEYVHNKSIFEKVKELNIDRSQGFYLNEPQETIVL